jgi:hypothetical protein
MGVMDFFKRGVGEMMIARPDAAKAHVVWKHPDPTIPMKAQLTVEADEKAVFFRDGKVVATLEPGRHTLDSANLPFLSNLVDSFTGGNVFIAEIFFVNVREQTGIKFGGRVGNVEDPKSHPGRDDGPRGHHVLRRGRAHLPCCHRGRSETLRRPAPHGGPSCWRAGCAGLPQHRLSDGPGR